MTFLDEIKADPLKARFFISKKKGGLNPCIIVANQEDNKGVVDPDLDVLGNCTAFATGMFNMMLGLNECKYLGSHKAKDYVEYAKKQGLTVTQKPVKGGVMVWSDNGNGHVEYVDKISADGNTCYDLSSGYASYIVANRTRKKNTGAIGNWGFKSPTEYLGCINPPKIIVEPISEDKEVIIEESPNIYLEVGSKKYRFVLEEAKED